MNERLRKPKEYKQKIEALRVILRDIQYSDSLKYADRRNAAMTQVPKPLLEEYAKVRSVSELERLLERDITYMEKVLLAHLQRVEEMSRMAEDEYTSTSTETLNKMDKWQWWVWVLVAAILGGTWYAFG